MNGFPLRTVSTCSRSPLSTVTTSDYYEKHKTGNLDGHRDR
nr:MAG TPA: hypothetical protein [Caudoviricetes sp.]